MVQPRYLLQPTIVRLPTLLVEVAQGEIRIPRFQRQFRWGDAERLLLFDSIYLGMPIGSIFVWRTRQHDLGTFAHLGDLQTALPEEPEAGTVKQYLLDGLQRLTTLYTSLGKGLSSTRSDEATEHYSGAESEWIEFGEGLRPIYFNLEDKVFDLGTGCSRVPRHWLPLSILLDPYKLYEFEKKLTGLPEARRLVNRAEALATSFKDYTIPVVPMVSEDLGLVTETFQRINTSGQKMDFVNMVNALLWSPNFDINDLIAEIKSELSEVGWGDFEDAMILNVCKAALDLDIYGTDIREIKEALLENRQILEDAAKPLRAMANFLARRCRILGPAVLPYRYQAILLTEAIRTAGPDSPLSEEVQNALERWLWLTTYGEYFAGINYSRLRKALDHIRRVAQYGDSPTPPDLAGEVRPWPRFFFHNARSRAILLRMAELGPLGPKGEDQEPFRLVAEHGSNAAPMLFLSREVGDRTIAEGPENRIITDPRHLAPLRRILQSGEATPAILRSHGMGEEMADVLRAGDVKNFLIMRRNHLAKIEARFVEGLGLRYESESPTAEAKA